LVFSQFSSTLQWMKQELPKHGFQFRSLSGNMSMAQRAKALRDFQQDPPTTVFLLSMRAGAIGINLTQANKVFIMEPTTNPALEAQAIGRVHRLGQMKNVQVIRLSIDNTIETRLIDMLEKRHGSKNKGIPSSGESEKSQEVSIVGDMRRDKAEIVEEEFDFLFGIKNGHI